MWQHSSSLLIVALATVVFAGCELFDESFAPDSAPGSCLVGGPLPDLPVASEPGQPSRVLEGRFEAGPDGLRFAGRPVSFASPEGQPFAVELPDLEGRQATVYARLWEGRLQIHAARTAP